MPIHITQSDVKTNILILHTFRQNTSGPLAGAAERLIALYSTQLNETSRRELAASGLDLEGYVGKFEL